MSLSDEISRILQDHDRCPPAVRDYSRVRTTLILIMQAIAVDRVNMIHTSNLKDCDKCGRKRYE